MPTAAPAAARASAPGHGGKVGTHSPAEGAAGGIASALGLRTTRSSAALLLGFVLWVRVRLCAKLSPGAAETVPAKQVILSVLRLLGLDCTSLTSVAFSTWRDPRRPCARFPQRGASAHSQELPAHVSWRPPRSVATALVHALLEHLGGEGAAAQPELGLRA